MKSQTIPWSADDHGQPLSAVGMMLLLIALFTAYVVMISAFTFSTLGLFIMTAGPTHEHGIGEKGGLDKNNTKRNEIALLVPAWFAVPTMYALISTIGPSNGLKWAWSQFSYCFLLATEGWLVIYLDGLLMILGTKLIRERSNALKSSYESYKRAELSASSPNFSIRNRDWFASSISLTFSVIASVLLYSTGLTVLMFAAQYGLFEGEGGLWDLLQCYAYTWSWALAIAETLAMMLGSVFGLLGGVICLLFGPYFIYQDYKAKHCVRKESLTFWCLICIFCWSIGLGSASGFVYGLECVDMRGELNAATISLYESGATNGTLSWAIINNTTGNFNVTHDPYQPQIRRFGNEPLAQEFRCAIMSAYQLLPFLRLGALALISWGVLWMTWTGFTNGVALARRKLNR